MQPVQLYGARSQISGGLCRDGLVAPSRTCIDNCIKADLIAGGRGGGHLLSLYEHKSHMSKRFRLESKDAGSTADAII